MTVFPTRLRKCAVALAMTAGVAAATSSAVLAQVATGQQNTGADSAGSDAGGLRPFCTDRPTQTSAPCTVDRGHFQIESDLFNATYDRSGGVVTDTYYVTDPTLKYGLDDNTDVEVQVSPYEIVRTHIPGGDTRQVAGVSDVVLRLKHNLTGNRDGGWNVALFPFLQLPTGREGVGDGGVEGGLLVPVQTSLTKSITFGATPEVALYRNASGDGVHPVEVEVASLGIQLPAKLTFSPEIYVEEDQDPSGAITRCSADVALSWLATKTLQLDAGANVGLNPQTPAVQVYLGISHRF